MLFIHRYYLCINNININTKKFVSNLPVLICRNRTERIAAKIDLWLKQNETKCCGRNYFAPVYRCWIEWSIRIHLIGEWNFVFDVRRVNLSRKHYKINFMDNRFVTTKTQYAFRPSTIKRAIFELFSKVISKILRHTRNLKKKNPIVSSEFHYLSKMHVCVWFCAENLARSFSCDCSISVIDQ